MSARGAGNAPAVILVRPQLGQNIGMVCRAMLNCGLSDLRLVAPRDGWPNPEARGAASGADSVLDGARVYESVDQAVADLHHVFATTLRPREMAKRVVTPRAAAGELRAMAGEGRRAGVLFGPERSGLENEDVTRAETVITAPLNPSFGSLNLAQAVLLIGYEWYQAADETSPVQLQLGSPPAEKQDVENLMRRLESLLDATNYFHIPEKKPAMMRTLRNIFVRVGLSRQEVESLHGVLSALYFAPKLRRHRGGRPIEGDQD